MVTMDLGVNFHSSTGSLNPLSDVNRPIVLVDNKCSFMKICQIITQVQSYGNMEALYMELKDIAPLCPSNKGERSFGLDSLKE